jgi:hypothetical protein
MSITSFINWRFRSVALPNQEKMVCYFYSPESTRLTSLHDENHNVFRFNAQGEVVWQVQRDDSIRKAGWWDILHAQARERGEDGAREPFMEFILKYPDGSDNTSPDTGNPPDEAVWSPNCIIWLRGSAYQQYVLDPETGIARNVTVGRPRPW